MIFETKILQSVRKARVIFPETAPSCDAGKRFPSGYLKLGGARAFPPWKCATSLRESCFAYGSPLQVGLMQVPDLVSAQRRNELRGDAFKGGTISEWISKTSCAAVVEPPWIVQAGAQTQ